MHKRLLRVRSFRSIGNQSSIEFKQDVDLRPALQPQQEGLQLNSAAIAALWPCVAQLWGLSLFWAWYSAEQK